MQEICNATHCGRVLYLELAAASRRPLQLVFERGSLLSDRLKDFVQLEVLRVGLAVHRLVPSPLLCRHDRAEVAEKNVKLVNGNLVNKIINSPVCLAFEEQNSATDFYDSFHDQLNDNCFNNPNVHHYHLHKITFS